MTREEFLKLKDDLTNVVINYELLQRKSSFFANSYILEFHEMLEQKRYLQYENEYIVNAIAYKKDGKTLEEIKEYLEKSKEEFAKKTKEFNRQYELAQDMEKRCSKYSANDMEILDKEFFEYCKLYHPIIKAHCTTRERIIYNGLSMVYRLGNIAGFRNLLNENKDYLIAASFDEEEYDTIGSYYIETYNSIKANSDKLSKSYPLNLEHVFTSQEAYTNELSALRQGNHDLRSANKCLHQDFLGNFDFDFEL